MVGTDLGTVNGYVPQLALILNKRAIKRGHFILSAGGESTYYIDCRLISMCYDGLMAIGNALVNHFLIAGLKPTVVCGPESAGIPLVSAVVLASPAFGYGYDLEGCFTRKEVKGHGTKQAIEGYQPGPADRVLMVEDVATSGASLLKSIEVVRATGATIIAATSLVDKLQGAGEKIHQAGVPYAALLTVKDLGLV